MSSSTNKKALIQRFEREYLQGYLNPGAFLQPAGIELLNLAGNLAETVDQVDLAIEQVD